MDVEAYLARIEASPSDSLADLTAAHLAAVPFENLSVHLPEPVRLDPGPLLDKIVSRRRGGFCYELNGAFALLLEALGHEVTRLSCRVATPDGFSFPGDHVALAVREGERRVLVDVGFGRFANGPIDLDTRADQADRFGTFAVRDAPDGDVDVVWDGSPAYRVDLRPRTMTDFVPVAWWHTTSPDSPFAQGVACSRVTSWGRVTLSGHKLIETTDDGERAEHDLEPGETLAAYRTWFGISLDRVPEPLHPRTEG